MTKRTQVSDGSFRIDLSGQKFGKLTVVKYAGKDKRNRALFYCKCECGNSKVVRGNHIAKGSIKSCGCLQGYNKNKRDRARYHVGEAHNKLTIIDVDYNNKNRKQPGYRQHLMVCKCSCGSSKKVLATYSQLTKGQTKSCGCYKNEQSSIRGYRIGLKNCKKGNHIKWCVDGLQLRSGFEVLFVLGLKRYGIHFEYEPAIFKLKNGMRYLPDFYLPEINMWIEVKGKLDDKDMEKMKTFAALGYRIMLYTLKDIEQFSGMKYSALYRSKEYRSN